MGYEMSVTLMQVAMMYATIANGGRLLKPKITLPDNGIANSMPPVKPEVVRRVLTEATALQLRRTMEQVVERGTGKKARVDGLRICGKTGTSHKYNKSAGGYYAHQYWASFSGFFPADDPQYVLCVSFDNPSPQYYGGDVAAPAFKRIVQRMLNIGEIRDRVHDTPAAQMALKSDIDNSAAIMPDFANRRWNTASQVLNKMGVNAHKNNEGVYIVGQDPAPGKKLENGRRARFDLAPIPADASAAVKMPNLVGLSLREAVNQLDRLRIGSQISGSGKVIQQSVSPGETLPAAAVCRLTCRPPVNLGQFSNW
jgi:membrane peptidoglycan carboxypeptidase